METMSRNTLAVVSNPPAGLRRGLSSSPNFNGAGQRPKSSLPAGHNAIKVSSKPPSSSNNLGLLGPICWRLPPVTPGDYVEKQSEQERGCLLLADRPLRNSDSSQTWSSEENDSSDVEGAENEGSSSSGKELKGGKSGEQIEETEPVLRDTAEERLKDVSPLKVIVITAGATYSLALLQNFINKEPEYTLTQRAKKVIFHLIRRIPKVKRMVEVERKKVQIKLEDDMNKFTASMDVYNQLPMQGRSSSEILKEAEIYLDLGDCDWEAGSLSGCVYNADKEVTKLVTQIYGMSAWSNPLHPDVFPGIRKMEAEIVQMGIRMFHGGPNACGTMTSGGSESLLLVCKAYRDYAREVKGILHPEILIPASGHAAFDKAAQLYRMRLTRVPLDPVTMKVDIKAYKRAITKNTCLLLGSAPGFPHGVIDDIMQIAALGLKYDIPVHVDACLGGFIVAFMDKAGAPLAPFDFRVKGVTSISADTHKYGYAPKGSSLILYSDPKYRQHQFSIATEWPGGLYASPTLAGSRPGGLIAACWASMMFYGESGYVEATKKIVAIHRYIEKGLREIDGIRIMGKPDACIVAFDSPIFNIYMVSDFMSKKGWHLSPLQFPPGIHLTITYLHTREGVAKQFLDDIREAVAEIKKNPGAYTEGSTVVYGTTASIPDRSLVSEITGIFLDSLYSLKQTDGQNLKEVSNGNHNKA
uniref:sphinganine-1-phosphate aldolase n=1 Tax=Alona affinis TaxID=381656 RepID=A0A9N6ZEF3_9CRUS|nr:EOG090X051L [Alona affinis]